MVQGSEISDDVVFMLNMIHTPSGSILVNMNNVPIFSIPPPNRNLTITCRLWGTVCCKTIFYIVYPCIVY